MAKIDTNLSSSKQKANQKKNLPQKLEEIKVKIENNPLYKDIDISLHVEGENLQQCKEDITIDAIFPMVINFFETLERQNAQQHLNKDFLGGSDNPAWKNGLLGLHEDHLESFDKNAVLFVSNKNPVQTGYWQKSQNKEKRKLVYQARKPKRRTAYKIYCDGTIVIRGPTVDWGLHIAKGLFRWKKFPKSKEEGPLKVKANFEISSSKTVKKLLANVPIIIKNNNYGTYIFPLEKERIKEIIPGRRVVKCTINGGEPIPSTAYFEKAVELSVTTELPKQGQLKLIAFGGQNKTKFTLYQNEQGQLFLHCSGIMNNYGHLVLSDVIGRYIKGWFLKEELVVCSKDEETPIVLKTTIKKRKSRPDQTKKRLNFPYYGVKKKVEVYFTNPDWQLNKATQQELQLKEQLRQIGINLALLKANTKPEGTHQNRLMEKEIRRIIREAFQEEAVLLSEATFVTKKNNTENPEGNRKIIDIVVITEVFGRKRLLLIEIRTSKNEDSIAAIATIQHMKRKLGTEKVIPIIFLNREIDSSRIILTRNFGYACETILVGPREWHEWQGRPNKLLTRIREFIHIQKLTQRNQQWIIHPETGIPLPKRKLEEIAFALLESIKENKEEGEKMIEQYCQMMELTITDFWFLYKQLLKEEQNDSKTKTKIQQVTVGFNRNLQPIKKELLNKLHHNLCREGYFAIIKRKKQFKESKNLQLLLEKEVVLQSLPFGLKVRGEKKRGAKSAGRAFEQEVRRILEKQGYQVVSNVLFSYYGRLFELDHLAFQGEQTTIISCKDRSNFQRHPNLLQKIRNAATKLEFQRKLLNVEKAKLFVKVKPEFVEEFKKRFENKDWVKGIQIFIS